MTDDDTQTKVTFSPIDRVGVHPHRVFDRNHYRRRFNGGDRPCGCSLDGNESAGASCRTSHPSCPILYRWSTFREDSAASLWGRDETRPDSEPVPDQLVNNISGTQRQRRSFDSSHFCRGRSDANGGKCLLQGWQRLPLFLL